MIKTKAATHTTLMSCNKCGQSFFPENEHKCDPSKECQPIDRHVENFNYESWVLEGHEYFYHYKALDHLISVGFSYPDADRYLDLLPNALA